MRFAQILVLGVVLFGFSGCVDPDQFYRRLVPKELPIERGLYFSSPWNLTCGGAAVFSLRNGFSKRMQGRHLEALGKARYRRFQPKPPDDEYVASNPKPDYEAWRETPIYSDIHPTSLKSATILFVYSCLKDSPKYGPLYREYAYKNKRSGYFTFSESTIVLLYVPVDNILIVGVKGR